jgi:hypothetical protein
MPVYWKKGKRRRDSGYLLYEWFYSWCDLLYSLCCVFIFTMVDEYTVLLPRVIHSGCK